MNNSVDLSEKESRRGKYKRSYHILELFKIIENKLLHKRGLVSGQYGDRKWSLANELTKLVDPSYLAVFCSLVLFKDIKCINSVLLI